MIRYKMKKSAIAHQEELALDMKILEKCLEDLRVEELGRKDDRQRLKKETLQYLDYLREQVLCLLCLVPFESSYIFSAQTHFGEFAYKGL